MENLKKLGQFPWGVWGLVLFVTLSVHSLTIRISPTIWQDEVQIVDYGRVLAPGADRSHAMTWLDSGRAAIPLNYLGCLMQNYAYLALGGDFTGPRIASLFGAGFAATALFGWLLARGSSPWTALALGVIFFWDPMLVQGFRGARVDVWAMGFMFFGFWLNHSKKIESGVTKNILIGACVAISGLMWASSILLVPLLFYEILQSAGKTDETKKRRIKALFQILLLASVWTLLFLLPYHQVLSEMVKNLATSTGERVNETSPRISQFLEPYKMSPFLLAGSAIAICCTKNKALWTAVGIAILAIFITGPYIHRNTYLLPYLIIVIQEKASCLGSTFWRKAGVAFLMLAAAWAGTVSLGARSIISLLQKEERNPEKTSHYLQLSLAGVQEQVSNLHVLLANWQLYFAARKENIKYFNRGLDWSQPGDLSFLRKMDVLLFNPKSSNLPPERTMNENKFTKRGIPPVTSGPRGGDDKDKLTADTYQPPIVWIRTSGP